MSPFAVDKRDIQFVLNEYLNIEKLCKLPKYADYGREQFDMVVTEAIKFSTDILAPLNIVLDREGLGFEKGIVTTPKGCKEAYAKFLEAGWGSPTGSVELGGQGLPMSLNAAITEIMCQASMSFCMTPGLTRSAAHVIDRYGTDEQRKTYVEKMNSGVWGGTMCLTEAGAGSAVGDLKSKARRDGKRYLIEGEKIFISAGDHDLTENIIHLVLARIEGASRGMKGVSLFLVPKVRVKPDGSLDAPNNVVCGNIEHKMGIHGSPTCTLLFGGDGPCYGELIGEENEGIKYMFLMMNEARLGVSLQGLSSASGSYQEALQYARERIQGVDIADMKDVDAPRVPIIRHPDVRRNLLTMKAFTEGIRAMLYFTAYCIDQSEASEDEETRTKYKAMLDLLTPICKAYSSDWGFAMTSIGIQVFGGYGYTQEFPQEQYCRDVKIVSIYEGTNGIQALDLLGRKVAGKGMVSFMTFINHVNEFINEKGAHPVAGPYVKKLEEARDKLTQVVMHFGQKNMEGDIYTPVLNATPFLEMFGHIVVAFFLLDMGLLAHEKLEKIYKGACATDDAAKKKVIEQNPEAKFYAGKLASMRFFADNYLPHAHAIADTILSGNRDPLDIVF